MLISIRYESGNPTCLHMQSIIAPYFAISQASMHVWADAEGALTVICVDYCNRWGDEFFEALQPVFGRLAGRYVYAACPQVRRIHAEAE